MPQTVEQKRAYEKAWRHANPDRVRAARNLYRATHPRNDYRGPDDISRAKNRKYWQSRDAKLTMYRRNAERRDIEFMLTRDEFLSFWQKPCHYCGISIETIGLDRVDNAIGYLAGNVESCCKSCNYAKAGMTTSQFLAMCHRIVARHP